MVTWASGPVARRCTPDPGALSAPGAEELPLMGAFW